MLDGPLDCGAGRLDSSPLAPVRAKSATRVSRSFCSHFYGQNHIAMFGSHRLQQWQQVLVHSILLKIHRDIGDHIIDNRAVDHRLASTTKTRSAPYSRLERGIHTTILLDLAQVSVPFTTDNIWPHGAHTSWEEICCVRNPIRP